MKVVQIQGFPVHLNSVVHASGEMAFTVRLHVMQRTVLLSQFYLSVHPSVRHMRKL